MNASTILTGGCHCGQVRYEIDGEIRNQGICHCIDCQKLTGGTAWPFLFIRENAITLTGEYTEYERAGFSGKRVSLGFCPNCGTTLFGNPDYWVGHLTVSTSTLDHPEYFSPKMHVWADQAPKWQIFHANLPVHERNP